MRKICVITGTRAEYGLLYWVMKSIESQSDLKLQLIVTGMHLSPEFGLPTQLDRHRALLHSVALLRFDFEYGDLIRWMGGKYTNRHLDWTSSWDKLLRSRKRPLPADYPVPDFRRAYRVQTEGVPLKGHFETPSEEASNRNEYNNPLSSMCTQTKYGTRH